MKPYLQFDRLPWKKCTAALFVLLMAGFGFVQAVHVHDALAGRTSPPSHCSLCVATHQTAAITPVSAAPVPVVQAAITEHSQPQLDSRLRVGASFIRPPPQDL
jgi:hypothetical protein